ncbi:MAG: HAD family hydrolase [Treponema sp.]|jgi:Cof subfamily protein (haloacid dehalogenase superfamily)|nr:HAD family hydrolase [Treponema sp.]
MVKLVVCDIDGTLIEADEILDKKAPELVRLLETEGIGFSLASGRSDYLVRDYAEQLNLSIPYITCNGAALVHKGRRLREKLMPAAPLKEITELADSMGFSIVYSQQGGEWVWRETPWILKMRRCYNRYHQVHRFTPEQWENELLDKILIYDDSEQGGIDIIEEGCKKLFPQFTATRYMDCSVEIVNGGASKALGVIDLAAMLGISTDAILAVGDHQNDIEMIRAVGQGAAVGNATSALKAAASYICRADYFAGVFEAVNHFCFTEKNKGDAAVL